MKVLHVIDSGGLYGAERVVLSLMKAHQEQGIEVELASIGEPGVPEKAIETEASRLGLRWRRFTVKAGPDLKGIRLVVRHAVEQGVSVIHSHGYKANILLAALPKRSRKLPVLATLHGWVSAGKMCRMKLYEMAERALLPNLDRVVAVNDHMVNGSVLAHRLNSRLDIIRNAIDPRMPAADDYLRNSIGLDQVLQDFLGNSKPFISIGRLSIEKDIATCLRALKIVIGEGHDACLVIFGEGGEKNRLEALAARLGISHRVLFFGYCNNIDAILNRFLALVISSLTEGVPIVALEAMRARVPIIATRVGGLPEIVIDEETGFLVPTKDHKAMAIAMANVCQNDKIAKQLGNAGRERLLAKYDIRQAANRYLCQYRRCRS